MHSYLEACVACTPNALMTCQLAGVSTSEYTAVPMQGSGTFAVESVFQTTVPRTNGKVRVLKLSNWSSRGMSPPKQYT